MISFGLPAAGCKKNNEKPQTPPTPAMTYTADVNLFAAQQTIRGFGGATVVRPHLTETGITTLLGNTNNNQPELTITGIRISSITKMSDCYSVFGNWSGLEKKTKFNVNEARVSAFAPHIALNTKNFIIERAVNICRHFFTYDCLFNYLNFCLRLETENRS